MDNTVVFVAGDRLGRGDDQLGEALMLAAIKNLAKAGGGLPSHILFMNNGVRLCCTGSNALDDLRGLSAAGVELLSCGTCLDWFDLKDRLAAGRESSMIEIIGLQKEAGRVVRL
ncbi:sulfurtransferase-like selenium metabolism protein YedF [bacterium]|nr:sulfurtransferase-like selenium metabolism protein YedF [bacterium]MBU1072088.1 sulfurtransferase-like selenium metabolism protein YedF [bacterium]MBU1675437.1 sulfurtransferase-like selenium metabolism protein YedF [bacterium]